MVVVIAHWTRGLALRRAFISRGEAAQGCARWSLRIIPASLSCRTKLLAKERFYLKRRIVFGPHSSRGIVLSFRITPNEKKDFHSTDRCGGE